MNIGSGELQPRNTGSGQSEMGPHTSIVESGNGGDSENNGGRRLEPQITLELVTNVVN